MSNPAIPLVVAKDIEQQRSWEGISTPYELALYMSRILSMDLSGLGLLEEVIFSNMEPQGLDRKKLWIKTDEPVAFCIPSGDNYTKVFRYPPFTPLLWTVGVNDLPSYMRKLSQEELDKYSLTKPSDTSFFWVIFTP